MNQFGGEQSLLACAQFGAKRSFYPELESLRGIAAMTVVVAHCCEGFLQTDRPDLQSVGGVFDFAIHLISPAAAAVILFFVLSGFVLTQGTEDQPIADAARNYPGYAIRRCFRIMPAMWLSAIAAFVVACHYYLPLDFRLLAKTLLMQDSNLNGPLWSLPIEMFWSLLLPALFFVSTRVGFVGNVVMLVGAYRLIHNNAGIDLLRYALCFQLGMLVGVWGRAITANMPRKLLLILLGAAVLAYCSIQGLSRLYFPGRSDLFIAVVAPAAFVMVSYFAHVREGTIGGLLRLSPIRFIGRISYSVYVFHFVLLTFVNVQLGIHLGQAWGEAHTLICHLIALVTVIPLTLIVAYLNYRYIEAPLTTIGGRLARGLSFSWKTRIHDGRRCAVKEMRPSADRPVERFA
jgi:peptidoglycan/LPS O-acetylase OafA/YrhL